MQLGPWILLLGMVVVTAGLPLVFSALRPPARTALLYGFVVVLQLVRGFLGATYVMPLADGLNVVPNNVLYTAMMMTSVLLVLVERRRGVLRNVILLLLATEVLKIAIFATTRWALSSPDFVSVADIPVEMYENILWVSGIGNVLVIAELLVVVVLFEQVRRRVPSVTTMSMLYVAIFAAVIVADGLLFPVATAPFVPGLTDGIADNIGRKVLLAALFSLPLLAFVAFHRNAMERYRRTPLSVRDVLFVPRRHLVRDLEQHERARIALLERTRDIAEEERRRLAEDLHDEAIQLFTAADIRLQLMARRTEGVDVGPAQELVRSGVESLRRLILELRSPEVTPESFSSLVQAYADRLLPAAGVRLELDVALPDDAPPDIVAAAHRIVMEGISNVARHAEADHVAVTVSVSDAMVVGEVVDDGIGIADDAETGPGHLGLRAMRDRAETVGGRVDVAAASDGNGGTVVAFSLPYEVECSGVATAARTAATTSFAPDLSR